MRIKDTILQCVAFLGEEQADKSIRFCGTGFFVSVPISEDRMAVCLVTAKHVAGYLDRLPRYYIRVNRKDGTSAYLYYDSGERRWWYHPSENIDVAVTLCAPPIEEYEWLPISLNDFATPDNQERTEYTVGLGDRIIVPGLFSKLTGTERNVPIVRFGNIAMMPGEKIPTDDFGEIDAYLIESRSIGGLSGSPVFVVTYHKTDGLHHPLDPKLLLLGLIHGHGKLGDGLPISMN